MPTETCFLTCCGKEATGLDTRETLKIMAVLKAAYPRYYQNAPEEDIRQAAALWETMLKDESYEVVSKAVKALIATEKFVPTIADVIEKIRLVTSPPALGEVEAWALVKRAIKNGYYHSREEFERLPESVRAAIGHHEVLREWSQVDVGDVETVVGSNFMRSYRAKEKQRREFAALPGDVRRFMALAAEAVGKNRLPDTAGGAAARGEAASGGHGGPGTETATREECR